MRLNFDNTYVHLPGKFYQKIKPTPVLNPTLIQFNKQLADVIGVDYRAISAYELAKIFSGNRLLQGSEPIAQVYAGHQFGHFVPQLGDGRAILLGEIVDPQGRRYDIQLKGAGRTLYSRNGDGRAALGPMIREYIVSEAMHALGIKTTRALALVKTGEAVLREGVLPGAILTRVASSHIRIGTFEYFAAQADVNSLKILADYTISRHYPEIQGSANPYLELLKLVQQTYAYLIADWMRVGFIHGVMNTDNVALSGETLDYGPCAFIDEYHPEKIFSSIDIYGRYRFNRQASICEWNLVQLAQSLALLIDSKVEKAHSLLHDFCPSFQEIYKTQYLKTMCRKIGILSPRCQDQVLIDELLEIIQQDKADYTLTFRFLSEFLNKLQDMENLFFNPTCRLEIWMKKWQKRLQEESISLDETAEIMLKTNPAVIPRNHKIEEVIRDAIEYQDFSKMDLMLKVLSNPYQVEYQENPDEYMRPPTDDERVHQTFCGT